MNKVQIPEVKKGKTIIMQAAEDCFKDFPLLKDRFKKYGK